jgi:molybdopterin-guanine dinucleotide biosynthesis protein A
MTDCFDKNQCTGLILAGGAGRRVGGQDKGLLNWRGRSLVEHVAERLRPQVGQLILSCNRNHARYRDITPHLISDARADYQGPLAGLEAAAECINTPVLIVVACDTPLLPDDLVVRLCRALTPEINVSYANDGERDQYLFAAINSHCLTSLPAYLDSGQRRVFHWYREQGCTAVDFSDRAACFDNMNALAEE